MFRRLSDIADAVSTAECHKLLNNGCRVAHFAAHEEIARDARIYLDGMERRKPTRCYTMLY